MSARWVTNLCTVRNLRVERNDRHQFELLLATLGGSAQGFPAPVIGYRIGLDQ